MRTSLMNSTEIGIIAVVGDKVPAAGYYGPTQGAHTVAIRTANFRGRIYVEATLILEPTDQDWFSVLPNNLSYLEFPLVPSRDPYVEGQSTCYGFTFQYNCLWVRARMDRSYMVPNTSSESFLATYGLIDQITLVF